MSTPDKIVERYHDGVTPWRYTSLGSYPLYYLTRGGDLLCPDCAAKSEDDPDEYERDKPQCAGIHWEGDPVDCDQCSKSIESAYGGTDD